MLPPAIAKSPSVRSAGERPRAFNYRQLFWKWHLYAGWLGGPLIILIAVTGAILVFSPEIDELLRPDLWKISPPVVASTTVLPDQQIVDSIIAKYPDETIIFYRQAERADQPYLFLMNTRQRRGGIHDVWINQYTGEIVGERMRETSFVRIVEQLHRRLLNGEQGSRIVELVTGWMIILTLTGIYLWWPKTWKTLKHGLTLSFKGSAYKVNWRLHNTLGAWTAIVMLLMCVTGMVFSTYTGSMYQSVKKWSTVKKDVPPPSAPLPGQTRVAIDSLLAIVRPQLPPGTPLQVTIPRGDKGHFVLATIREHRPQWHRLADLQSWTFDQYSGQQIEFKPWNQMHVMDRFWTFCLTVHYGSIFGLPTKIIALLVCLLVPILPLSGYLIWWWKRQKKKQGGTVTTRLIPRKLETQPLSRWLVASLIVVSVIFPTIGVSFLVLFLWECLSLGIRRLRRPATQPTPPEEQVAPVPLQG